jgi:hypothetical protein
MKKYRVTFRPYDGPGVVPKTEVVEADRWKVEEDLVCLYKNEHGTDIKVFDVPKQAVMKVIEVV